MAGLAIEGFSTLTGQRVAGIHISGSDNMIVGDYIGIAPTGSVAAGNSDGVSISAGSHNVIGGTRVSNTGTRNIISGNSSEGIYISGGKMNVVEGNYIGTNAAGTKAVGNHAFPVWR